MVAKGNGSIPLSVANDLKPNGVRVSVSYVYWAKQPDANGHRYLAVNYLGNNIDIDAAWKIVTSRLSDVFPVSRVAGSDQPIAMGNQYNLIMGGPRSPVTQVYPVKVTAVSQYTFTLTAGEGHQLQGSATHGIFKDNTGAVWLFQEGVGVQNEPAWLQDFNYGIADVMWARMARNVRSRLNQ